MFAETCKKTILQIKMLICKSVNNLFNQYSRFLHLATAAHFLLATETPLKTALSEKAGLSVPKFTTK